MEGNCDGNLVPPVMEKLPGKHIITIHMYDAHMYDTHMYDAHMYDAHMYDVYHTGIEYDMVLKKTSGNVQICN